MTVKEEDNYSSSTLSTVSIKDESNYPTSATADFETAIDATSFGIFNLLLLLTAVPAVITSQLEASSLAYVLPAAQCDLELTLEAKGLVNAILYTGMIISCFIWGSLVDVFGRRKILIITNLLDTIFVLMAALSPNFLILAIAKFMGGFTTNGISMALTPYLSEFHAKNYRSRVPLSIGFMYSSANLMMPLLAWLILPLDIKISLFGGLEFHAWNLFLLICALPAVTSGILFALMPETPKYLMTKGNNEEALGVFQKIYHLNTKQPKESYPINKLQDEKQIYQKKRGFGEAWNQLSPLFALKYVSKLILTCSIMMFLMLCINTLRLWLPEIFQILNDYEYYNNETASFCKMLVDVRPNSSGANATETCYVNFDNDSVYTNSVIVAFTAMCGYVLAAFIINKVGKKKLLICLELVSGASVAAVYFAPSVTVALILICANLTCSSVCVDILITIVIDLFPTYLRASALSLTLMCGRIGTVLGNLIFPLLLQTGCAPPFFTFGSLLIGCTIVSLFLPNTDFKALE